MEEVNRPVVKNDGPSFYTEKVKEPKKKPVLKGLVQTVTSALKGR